MTAEDGLLSVLFILPLHLSSEVVELIDDGAQPGIKHPVQI